MPRNENWTLVATSAAHAARRPDRVAVICEDRRMTYRRLHEVSNAIGHRLVAAGVRPGSRVAYLGRESEFYYATVLGSAKAGSVLVPVNWRLTPAEVDHILGDSCAEMLFVDGEFESAVRPRLAGLRDVVRVDRDGDPGGGLLAWCANAPRHDLDPGTGPDDAVVQIYTSGTTGLPKGAVLAHRAFYTLPAAMAEANVTWFDFRPDDVSLVSLPGLGIAGIGWFMHNFVAGAAIVVMRMFLPSDAVRLIREHGVTTTFAAPAMLQMMLAERGVDRDTFRSFRKVVYGAAPIPESLLRRCLDVFDCEFSQIYASTETGSAVVCLPPYAHHPGSTLLGAAGRACPGTELKVVDRDGHEVGPGVIGQVCVRTPARMLGYWRLPEATAQAIDGEWLRMGDAGYLDEAGYLYLCDRINDTIIVAGQNIYPAEIEKALADHPDVVDAAVVGVPDPRWGEAVQACVVARPGTAPRPRDLLLFLRGKIADYKIPTGYHLVDTLPRNPSGKVLRRVVRDRLTTR